MYPYLKSEMAKRSISLLDLAELTGIRYQTLAQTAQGKSFFKVEEAMKIKEAIGTDMPIDDLFSTEFKG